MTLTLTLLSVVSKVWFRRGVNSHNPCGSGWISIGGEMMMVDVGLNDQVKRCVVVSAPLLFNGSLCCLFSLRQSYLQDVS